MIYPECCRGTDPDNRRLLCNTPQPVTGYWRSFPSTLLANRRLPDNVLQPTNCLNAGIFS